MIKAPMVIGGETGNGASIYLNLDGLSFSRPLSIGEEKNKPYSIAIADMNGDCKADVVLGNQEAPGAVLINDGKGSKFTPVPFGDNKGTVYGLAIGDLNGDGSPDIVAARSEAQTMLFLNSLTLKKERTPCK
ncbi:MAG: VCBS repeat-containing protein [Acidobacteria bacterium]|nr:VCBS repeat-containing protein [Acidobacteriota bacterium]